MDKLEKLKKGLFTWASCLMLVFAVYNFVELLIYFDFQYILSYLPSLTYYGAIIALGVFLAARKNSLAVSILLLIISIVEVYWSAIGIASLVEGNNLLSLDGALWTIFYVLRFIPPIALAIISFADWKKIWSKLKKLWAVPVITAIIYFAIYLIYYVVGYIEYDLSNIILYLAIEFLYYLGLIMFTLTFANLETLKKLLDKTKGL